jgi:hypothetical protein
MALPYYLFYVEKRVCLSRDVYVTVVAWRAVKRIKAGVGDLVQTTGMVKHRSGTRWLNDQKVR